jgi:regulation of enolase protein 1 (concanavalin A-like superfamily)
VDRLGVRRGYLGHRGRVPFSYQPLSGDGQLIARVARVEKTYRWVKAAVMIRQTLNANSAYALMLVSVAAGSAFQYRTGTGVSAAGTSGAGATAPYWVKITRTGNSIAGYQSSDGSTWQLVGTVTIAMESSVEIGLGVTSHDTTKSCMAVFDHVGR